MYYNWVRFENTMDTGGIFPFIIWVHGKYLCRYVRAQSKSTTCGRCDHIGTYAILMQYEPDNWTVQLQLYHSSNNFCLD